MLILNAKNENEFLSSLFCIGATFIIIIGYNFSHAELLSNDDSDGCGDVVNV